MRLLQLLAPEFSSTTRARGDAYASAGAVDLIAGDEVAARALVQGTEPYAVTIDRVDEPDDDVRIEAYCSCPFAEDQGQACKHVWATLRVALEAGHLTGAAGAQLDGAYLELIDQEPPELPLAPSGRGSIAQSSGPSPSTRFLTSLRGRLTLEAQRPARAYPYAAGELLYVIDPAATVANGNLVIQLRWRKRKQTGEWGKPKPAPMGGDDVSLAPEIDRELLAALFGASRPADDYRWGYAAAGGSASTSFVLRGPLAGRLLPRIVATGRAVIESSPAGSLSGPLAWDAGAPWTFEVAVAASADGFGLSAHLARDGEQLALAAPRLVLSSGYLFTEHLVASLDHGNQFALLAELRLAGAIDVSPADATMLAEVLSLADVPQAALPESLQVSLLEIEPVPRLRFSPTPGYRDRLTADVSFDYDGTVVGRDGPPSVFDSGRRRRVRRSPAAELSFLNRLLKLEFSPRYDFHGNRALMELPARALTRVVPALLIEGWKVEAHGHAYRSPGAVTMTVASGIDWFDLEATVTFGDTSASLVDLLASLKRGEQTIALGDGSLGLLPEAWLRRYMPLAAAGQIEDGHLRFRRPQVALLDALLADQEAHATISFDDAYQRIRRELSRFDRITPADPPSSFVGTLREYQREGLGWLQFLRQFSFGGCLADDMGLGKTIMVLALFAWVKAQPTREGGARPSLVVVPRSLVHNWLSEAAAFTPGLRVLDASGAQRARDAAGFGEADVVLATYGTLRQDILTLKDVEFEYAVLDEAQAIKNASTGAAKAARLLRADHRLALSGTPIENHIGELWSLFEFLNPGLLGGSTRFARAATASRPDADTITLVARGLRPFILRRTKGQVASELPARTEQTITCDLAPKERAFYDELRAHYRQSLLARVDRVGLARSKMHILEALLRLRQAACHPGLVDASRRQESSTKCEVLVDRLVEVVAEGHKALVFSQFTSLLALVRPMIDKAGLAYEYLDGKTRDRQARVARFQQDPACPLFLISLKAGGVGLNLTAADYVFLLDPWWNPAVEAQAIDRTHRIGQQREVFAYRLIASDTVEEKVLELQRGKRQLADALLSEDAGGLRHIEREDLELLLS